MSDLETMLDTQETIRNFENKLRDIPKFSLSDADFELLLDELLELDSILSVEERTSLNMNVSKKSANPSVKKLALVWMKYLQQID